MTLPDLQSLAPGDMAALCGLTVQGNRASGLGCGPCPACKSGQVSAHDRRAPVLIRTAPEAQAGAWTCGACHRSGTRADLLALAQTGRGWSECSREEQGRILGRPAPVAQPGAVPTQAPRYLDAETVRRIEERSWRALDDEGCMAWARRRGLRLTPDLRALPYEPDPELPFWTSPTDRNPTPYWLPGVGFRLFLPTTDASGETRGGQLRNTKQDAQIKERGMNGYSSVGLVYASLSLRALWAEGIPSPRPCLIVEGKPDQLAAWMAWGRTHEVIGIRSGSLPGKRWPELLHQDVRMIVQLDPVNQTTGRRQADDYWRALVRRVPRAQRVDMAAVYAAAGVAHAEKLDLASEPIRGRWPGVGVFAP